jgi:hypothetical protein
MESEELPKLGKRSPLSSHLAVVLIEATDATAARDAAPSIMKIFLSL